MTKELMMKQNLLLIICAVLLSQVAIAQQVAVVDPNPSYGEGVSVEFDINAKAFLRNNTDQEITIGWRILTTDMPDEWETWVCDNNLCYGPNTTQTPDNRPVVLGPNMSGIMDSHIDPAGIVSEGRVEIEIYMFDDPSMVLDTGVYIFTTTLVNTDDLEDNTEEISVFPNPTSNFIMLEHAEQVDQMIVYNVLGKQLKYFRVNEGDVYDVAELPVGFYLLSLQNNEGEILKTLRLNKR